MNWDSPRSGEGSGGAACSRGARNPGCPASAWDDRCASRYEPPSGQISRDQCCRSAADDDVFSLIPKAHALGYVDFAAPRLAPVFDLLKGRMRSHNRESSEVVPSESTASAAAFSNTCPQTRGLKPARSCSPPRSAAWLLPPRSSSSSSAFRRSVEWWRTAGRRSISMRMCSATASMHSSGWRSPPQTKAAQAHPPVPLAPNRMPIRPLVRDADPDPAVGGPQANVRATAVD